MIATIYMNDNFNAPFFKLTESITDNSLKALEMSNAITSIKVAERKGLNCDQQCVIVNNHTIILSDVFGKYWNDERLKNKQILLVFNTVHLGEGDNYALSLFNGATININNSRIEFYNEKMNNDFYFEHDKRNDNLSFIIQMKKILYKYNTFKH